MHTPNKEKKVEYDRENGANILNTLSVHKHNLNVLLEPAKCDLACGKYLHLQNYCNVLDVLYLKTKFIFILIHMKKMLPPPVPLSL